MNEFLNDALGLDALRFGQEGVRFAFERGAPVWLWVGAVALAFVGAWWSYRRLAGPLAARGVLGGLRGLTLALLLVLLAGPSLVQRNETLERDAVVVLVDRSQSMTIEDAPGGAGESARRAREAQLREALESSSAALGEVGEQRDVLWLGFGDGAFDLAAGAGEGVVELGDPDASRTSLGTALDQALRRVAARPLSSVVVLSDGRSVDEPSRSALRTLQGAAAPVHVVPLGSETPIGDAAIARVDGPGVAFLDDPAPVTVDLERLGAETERGATVRLVEPSTGLVLQEKRIEPGEMTERVVLTHRPNEPGETVWRVELDPDGEDLIEGNNSAEVAVRVIDRPLRTLYIDGYPRWEQRYLRNLLIREGSVVSSNLMLAPDRRYLQEGDVEIDSLPDSPEGWAEYDVVILGDVRADVFTPEQLEHLRLFVAERGGGLLWIGGQGATPESWWGTALAELLPFVRSGASAVGVAEPMLVRPAPAAERYGVLRLSEDPERPWPEELADPDTGWSALRWAQRIDPGALKPAAEPLAVAWPPGSPGSASPLVVSMRYGAGRSIYVATDETWRWRFGRGELLYERFWLQLVRMLGRERLAHTGQAAALEVTPRRALVGRPVRVSVELLDQSLIDLGMESVAVRLSPAGGEDDMDAPAPERLELRPESEGRRVFAATWVPSATGRWIAEPVESALAGEGLSAEVVVIAPDDELRRPETDHALLAGLASQTGGRVIAPGEMALLADPGVLPSRELRIVTERREALWDTPLALGLLLTLLTLEWVIRRLIRLI